MARWEEERTLFYRILLTTAGDVTTVTVVDWHLKDRVRCWSNQKLLHHSQHAKNSSIY